MDELLLFLRRLTGRSDLAIVSTVNSLHKVESDAVSYSGQDLCSCSYRMTRRGDFSSDDALRIIGRHLKLIQAGQGKVDAKDGVIKRDKRVNVSLIDDGARKVCVKHFLCPHPWDRVKERFRTAKGMKAWNGGNGLEARGIPSIRLFAYVERRDWLGVKEGFLLMEAPENALRMDEYILKKFKDMPDPKSFALQFAAWLSSLHDCDVWHQDMKTCNIMVSEAGGKWTFLLLDLEDIQLDTHVDEKKSFRNFLQLNTSTPPVVSRTSRLRFFRAYRERRPGIGDGKDFLKRLVRESLERGMDYV